MEAQLVNRKATETLLEPSFTYETEPFRCLLTQRR